MVLTGLLLSVLASYACLTSAMPSKSSSASDIVPLQITQLSIVDRSGGSTSLSFRLHDPDVMSNATAICSGSWPHGSNGYPSGPYVACGNSTQLAWNVASWNGPENFVLNVESGFVDPSVGAPPYDYLIDFGQATISSANVNYDVFGATLRGTQPAGTIISAPVTESTA